MLSKLKRKFLKYSNKLQPAVFLVIILLLFSFTLKALLPVYNFIKKNNLTPSFFSALLFNTSSTLKQSSGRTNILILGIGGGNHEGPDLTDSMIFLSLDPDNKDAVMLSLPRDIWSSNLKDKINTAYAYGEAKKKGGGLILAKSIVEDVVGQPIHYAWLIDFSGFKKLIDLVGGLDINVDNTFDDFHYPIEGKENDLCGGDPDFKCRYEHLHFDAGWQHMDGDRALKYVRSRYAEGDEGTDFARGKRQQKVILALKDKLLHHTNLLDFKNDQKLIKAFDDATDTDMNLSEAVLTGKIFLSLNTDKIRRPILDNGDENTGRKGYLVNPPVWQYNGAWVLVPRTGESDFSEIHQFIACWLNNSVCDMKP